MSWIANIGEAAAEQWAVGPDTVVVSITEPGRKARLPRGFVDMLRLEFQDYDPVGRPPISSTGMYTSADPIPRKVPKDAVLFTPNQAARLARFARKHRDRGRNFLIHCAAGISRSGAVAEALLTAFPEYEDRGWPRYPNGHVKALCKRALGLIPIGAEADS